MATPEQFTKALLAAGYVSNDKISSALAIMEATKKPLIVEGYPGVGKTSLAKAYAKIRGFDFLRVQMYGGLTYDKILYDYDTQKQRLMLEVLRPQLEKNIVDMDITEAAKFVTEDLDFYGPEFLIERPVLKSILSEKRCVLLIDEIDKASEDIEYMLYEFLEDYSLTIPQFGTVRSAPESTPMVFITSNKFRDVSGPFQRRCAYLYIDEKNREEIIDILQVISKVDRPMATIITDCYEIMKTQHFYSPPAISELADFAKYINTNKHRTEEFVLNSIALLAKDIRDENIIREIIRRDGPGLWDNS